MTTVQKEKIARRKLSLLQIAQELGNVSKACKIVGYSRQQFYEIRRNFQLYGADGLPFNTRYGDGDPIGADVVATLNEVYERHTVRTPWRPGDLLLVDNIRCAHSREPFEGPREVLVGLADPVRPPGSPADDFDAKDEVSFR